MKYLKTFESDIKDYNGRVINDGDIFYHKDIMKFIVVLNVKEGLLYSISQQRPFRANNLTNFPNGDKLVFLDVKDVYKKDPEIIISTIKSLNNYRNRYYTVVINKWLEELPQLKPYL